MQKFILFGLPRSGTTYLMTTLGSHSKIQCSGEQFNPYGIIGVSNPDRDPNHLRSRDFAPVAHSDAYFAGQAGSGHFAVGYKFMIGHNLTVLLDLAQRDDFRFIYVHRDNKLAQASSWIKAERTRNWAQTDAARVDSEKMEVNLFRLNLHAQEFATSDFLFGRWFETLKQPKLTVEYREMFAPGFNRRVTQFLGVPEEASMRSPLVKQNRNRVIDRFKFPGPIEHYFRNTGHPEWLEEEI